MNKGQKRELLRKVIFAVALILFIGSSTKLFLIWNEYNKNAKGNRDCQRSSPPPSLQNERGGEHRNERRRADSHRWS